MAFWTIATLGYLYTLNPTWFRLGLLLFLIFPASVGYYELQNLKENLEQLKSKSRRRNRNQPSRAQVWEIIKKIIKDETRGTGLLLASLNLIIGGLIYIGFVIPAMVWGEPDTVIGFLFILPLVWLSSVIWRVLKLN